MKYFTQSCIVVLLFCFWLTDASTSSRGLSKLQDSSYGCICSNYSCGCCAHIEAPRVGLNDTGCVNLTYLYKEYGISFTVTIDNLTIYNETISARNPPPICFGAPILKEYADLCLHFYDLAVSATKMHGCAQLEARLHKVVVGTYKLGCFDVGNSKWTAQHRKLIERIMKKHQMTFY